MMMNVYFIDIGAPYRANTFPDPDGVQSALTTVTPVQMPLREIYDGLELTLQNSTLLDYASYAAFEDPIARVVIFAALEPVGARYGGDGTQRVILHIDPFATMRASTVGAWMAFDRINCTSVSPKELPHPNFPTARSYDPPLVVFAERDVDVFVQFEFKRDSTEYDVRWCHTGAMHPNNAKDFIMGIYDETQIIIKNPDPTQPSTVLYNDVRPLRAYAVPKLIVDMTNVYTSATAYWGDTQVMTVLNAFPNEKNGVVLGTAQHGGRFFAGNPLSFLTIDIPLDASMRIIPRFFLNPLGDDLRVVLCAYPVVISGSPPSFVACGGDPAIVHDITSSLSMPIRSRPRTLESSVDGVKDALTVASGVLAVGTGIVTGNPLAVVGGGLSLAGTATSILEREEAKDRQRNERVTIAGDYYGAVELASGEVIGCFAVWCAPYSAACVNMAELVGCDATGVIAFTAEAPVIPYNGKNTFFVRGEVSPNFVEARPINADSLTMPLAKMQADLIREGVLFLKYEG